MPLSTPEAVLRYARDFLPSWAGAISIDLMPAILVLILVAVHAAIRRHENPAEAGNTMTAFDVMTAMRLYETMRNEEAAMVKTASEQVAAFARPDAPPPSPEPLQPASEPTAAPAPPSGERQPATARARNVTPISPTSSTHRSQLGGRRDQTRS